MRLLRILAALNTTLIFLATTTAADAKRPPNVIVILADDLGYADVGFQGCKDIPTPHLDALAKSGIRCTNGYVSHPFCSPTRAGLLTGRYQQRFGHEYNPLYTPEDENAGLPIDQVTLADTMKAAGYATGLVGKWHLGAHPKFHPNRRGFDEFFGHIGGGHIYFPNVKGSLEYSIPLLRNDRAVAWNEKDYLTDLFSREAADFVTRHRDQPFFLYLAYNAPHSPLQAPPQYLERVKGIADPRRKTYGAMVCAVDDGVGLVTAKLRELKLDEDTVVFFLSDNGGPGWVTHSSNKPLRGDKGEVFEGGIRVPFVVSWPTVLPPGTYDAPVTSLDIFATAAAVGKARVPENLKLDGVDLVPFLRREAKGVPHDVLFWRSGGGVQWAIREGNNKLLKPEGGKAMLFDLSKDVGETNDLSASHSELVSKLHARYDAWNRELVAPRFAGIEVMRKDKKDKK